MSGGAKEPGRSVTSRLLAILDTFDETHQCLTLSVIARRGLLPLSTVHRLVCELEDWRALSRDPAGGYRVGLRLWELGQLAPVRLRDGVEVLYVEKVYGRRAVPIVSRVGGRLPMHPTGVGKALLAHQPDWFMRSYLDRPLERPTAFTITEPGRLCRELADVRARDWAVTVEEMTLGSCRSRELPRLVGPLRATIASIQSALHHGAVAS